MANTNYPPIAGEDTQSQAAPIQPFAGEAPLISDTAVATANITQYQVCALTDSGIAPYVDDTNFPKELVVAAYAGLNGAKVGYYSAGKFNHAALMWPAEYDTLAKRKALVQGSMIHVGHLLPL